MFKRLLSACAVPILLTNTAYAANCSGHPYVLANGTVADANQVMADFDNLLNCSNSILVPLDNPRLTGSVGIGTTSPASTLDVRGNVRIGNSSVDAFGFFYTDAPSGTFSIEAANGANTTKKNLGLVMFGGNVGIATASPSLKLTVNGTAGGTSAWQVMSDARLKTNVQPVSNALDLVRRLNPVRFDWRKPTDAKLAKDFSSQSASPRSGSSLRKWTRSFPRLSPDPRRGRTLLMN